MPILEQVKEILASQLAVKHDAVKPDSKLRDDLGSDSIDALEIISSIEEQFKIDVSEEEATKVKTVADIVDLINQKLREKTQTQG